MTCVPSTLSRFTRDIKDQSNPSTSIHTVHIWYHPQRTGQQKSGILRRGNFNIRLKHTRTTQYSVAKGTISSVEAHKSQSTSGNAGSTTPWKRIYSPARAQPTIWIIAGKWLPISNQETGKQVGLASQRKCPSPKSVWLSWKTLTESRNLSFSIIRRRILSCSTLRPRRCLQTILLRWEIFCHRRFWQNCSESTTKSTLFQSNFLIIQNNPDSIDTCYQQRVTTTKNHPTGLNVTSKKH